MLIKKFIAQSLPEALSKVKADFGEEAVILKTRFNNKGNGNGSGRESASVEVTAAIDKVVKKTDSRKKTAVQTPAIKNRIALKPQPKTERSKVRSKVWEKRSFSFTA